MKPKSPLTISLDRLDAVTQILKTEFDRRLEKNPRYSTRAFAKKLGIDVSSLSRILRGKGHLSVKSALDISRRLDFAPQQTHDFLVVVIVASLERAIGSAAENMTCDKEFLRREVQQHWCAS